MNKGMWKEEAFLEQMSAKRDFPHGTPIKFQYAICCGHRTGSNLLGEALYKTGQAGDPMEFLNQRFLQTLWSTRPGIEFNFDDYYREMKTRRTSPNGIFGINVKIDQLNVMFKGKPEIYSELIKNNDAVIFLYRRDKLKQAISVHIGQSRDMYNVPADVDDEEIMTLVESVNFDPKRISHCLDGCIQIEQDWLNFFKQYDITFEPLAYEDFTENYEATIEGLLKKFGVPDGDINIPPQPMKKVGNKINEEFRLKFSEYIKGKLDPLEMN